MMNQQYQEPWLAVVVDPMRTMAAGKVEIGAFRYYTCGAAAFPAGGGGGGQCEALLKSPACSTDVFRGCTLIMVVTPPKGCQPAGYDTCHTHLSS